MRGREASPYPWRSCSRATGTSQRESAEEPRQRSISCPAGAPAEQAAAVTLSGTLAPRAASPAQITSSAGACSQVELWEARCATALALLGSPLSRLSSPSILGLDCPVPQSVLGPHPIWLPQEAPQTTPTWFFFVSPRSHFNGDSTCFAGAAGFQTLSPGAGLTPKSLVGTFTCLHTCLDGPTHPCAALCGPGPATRLSSENLPETQPRGPHPRPTEFTSAF